MIAITSSGAFCGTDGSRRKADAPLQFFLKAFGRPAVFEEEKLQAGTFPVLAQLFAFAKNLGDSLQDRDHLVALYKSIQPDRQMRVGR